MIKYTRPITGLDGVATKVDAYSILEAFDVIHPQLADIAVIALNVGLGTGNDMLDDIDSIISSAESLRASYCQRHGVKQEEADSSWLPFSSLPAREQRANSVKWLDAIASTAKAKGEKSVMVAVHDLKRVIEQCHKNGGSEEASIKEHHEAQLATLRGLNVDFCEKIKELELSDSDLREQNKCLAKCLNPNPALLESLEDLTAIAKKYQCQHEINVSRYSLKLVTNALNHILDTKDT